MRVVYGQINALKCWRLWKSFEWLMRRPSVEPTMEINTDERRTLLSLHNDGCGARAGDKMSFIWLNADVMRVSTYTSSATLSNVTMRPASQPTLGSFSLVIWNGQWLPIAWFPTRHTATVDGWPIAAVRSRVTCGSRKSFPKRGLQRSHCSQVELCQIWMKPKFDGQKNSNLVFPESSEPQKTRGIRLTHQIFTFLKVSLCHEGYRTFKLTFVWRTFIIS